MQLEKTFEDLNAENKDREASLKQQLKELEENIDKLKEGHFIKKEIDKSFYEKYLEKYTGETSKILEQLENCSNFHFEPENCIKKNCGICLQSLEYMEKWKYLCKRKASKITFS